ncbi:hypothetical protein ACTXOR_05010 [Arthrobacter rhombi]|uniref:hypothetical protein n=1 Tax=Arthrobacter rhombi TaxID=71253 RepID=UPI003FD3B1E1
MPAVPVWFDAYVEFIAIGLCPARAAAVIGELGMLLADGHPNEPSALVSRAQLPGRSMGTLARSLETLFVANSLAAGSDHAKQLAAGRRRRRIEAVPVALHSTVATFETSLVTGLERARNAGTLHRADSTIEAILTRLREFARFLAGHRNKTEWALVNRAYVEAFMALQARNAARTLCILKQSFKWARSHKRILIDPAAGIPSFKAPSSVVSPLALDDLQLLFRRWCIETVHPHEALTGLLGIFHGAPATRSGTRSSKTWTTLDAPFCCGGGPTRRPLTRPPGPPLPGAFKSGNGKGPRTRTS